MTLALGWSGCSDTSCKRQRSCAGPILSTADILKEEQYQVRGMFEQTAPPAKAGPTITVPAMLPLLSRTPGAAHTSSQMLSPTLPICLYALLANCF